MGCIMKKYNKSLVALATTYANHVHKEDTIVKDMMTCFYEEPYRALQGRLVEVRDKMLKTKEALQRRGVGKELMDWIVLGYNTNTLKKELMKLEELGNDLDRPLEDLEDTLNRCFRTN